MSKFTKIISKSKRLLNYIYGAPCTRHGLHFFHIFKRSLQIFSLQQFEKCNPHLQQVWQLIIFILQQARYLGSSHLHSSNLHLRLHAKTAIFKSSRKPAGSPIYIHKYILWNVCFYLALPP